MRDQQIQVVSITDPAIDPTTPWSVLNKYIDQRDLRIIEPHFLPGSKPQVFTIREIAQATFDNYVGEKWESSTARRALRAGLVRIDNMRNRDGSQHVEPWEAVFPAGTELLSDDQLGRIEGGAIRAEIGRVAYEHSFLPRWTSGGFLALDSSLELLGARRAHHAAASQSTPALSSDAASSTAGTGEGNASKAAPTPTTTGTAETADGSGSATAATATESQQTAA